MISLFRFRSGVVAPVLLLATAAQIDAQQQATDSILTAETFLTPAPAIGDAVLAPRHMNVTLGNPNPDGQMFLRTVGRGLATMASFAKPFHRLGGLQIDWQANRSRQLTTRSAVGIEIISAETGNTTTIEVPEGAGVSEPQWSPDGTSIAFLVHQEDATYVYTADPENGRSRQVTRTPVLATLYTSFVWTPDSRSIVTVLLPENRGAPPGPPAVPNTPQVRITTPETNQIRTYPDLLEGPHEKAMVEYYATGQLAVVDVQRRRAQRIGEPAMIQNVAVSPDGGLAQVTTMRKPFSYIVPTRQFGNAVEVWSLEDGSVLALLSEQELRDGAPDDTTDTDDTDPEKRDIVWRPDGMGLSFLQLEPREPGDTADQTDEEQEEEGEGRRGSRRPDRVFQWLPPFDSTSMNIIWENTRRLQGVRYSEDAQILFPTEQTGDNVHEYAVFLSDPEEKHTIYRGERARGFRRGLSRFPNLLTKELANGSTVIRVSSDGNHVFLAGSELHDNPLEDGPQSYIDKVEIRTEEKTRIYESDNDGVYERVLEVLNDEATSLVVSRESPTDVPDSYIRDVTTGDLRQVTHNTDYTPAITNAQRRRIEVTRVDDFKIAVNVTLPQNWRPGEKLPGMIWFYPREYTDQDSYDETRETYNKNSYPNVSTRSMEILTQAGYVVIQPDAPIVGESGRMNDNYVHDLRNNLAAVIDRLDAEGLVDRNRLGIGGHSYGAFSTYNAMVHTPFFKAGIAGDGNANRTLTPFSFQSERRTLWEAKDVYLEMSPFFQADHMSGALLMYHGEHDQNVGTFPIHSWRLFEALEALGKTASLYFYPYEDHGPATQETVLDLWARWTAWLDKYVKNAGEQDEIITTDDAGAGS
jgi:dipeptidyl aminopeptidase/acylaminoacyl peptidase